MIIIVTKTNNNDTSSAVRF